MDRRSLARIMARNSTPARAQFCVAPHRDPLKTYRVIVDGEIGRIETGQVQESEIATGAVRKTSVPGDPFPEIDLRVDPGFNF